MICGICKKEIPKKQVQIDNMHYEFEGETEKLFTADRQDSITICQKCYENLIWDQKETNNMETETFYIPIDFCPKCKNKRIRRK